MWNYEKRLQYPVNIKNPNGKIAQIIMSQYGGPDGEISASMRYLSQRFTMPNRKIMGILNDIGTEELAHLENLQDLRLQLPLTQEALQAPAQAVLAVHISEPAWLQSHNAGFLCHLFRLLIRSGVYFHRTYQQLLYRILHP